MTSIKILAAGIVALLAAACGGNDDAATAPKPHAWPRPPLYDADYDTLRNEALPVDLAVNRHAQVTLKSADGNATGLDITYPRYGATVYVTVVSGLNDAPSFSRAWQARLERTDVNLGGVPAQQTSHKAGHGGWMTVRATGTSPTPVHMLAGDPQSGIIVSATAFMPGNASAPYDSIAPLADALEADLAQMAWSLRYK